MREAAEVTRPGRHLCPHKHRGWDEPLPLDRVPARYGGGWSCPGIRTDGTDCGYELTEAGASAAVRALHAQFTITSVTHAELAAALGELAARTGNPNAYFPALADFMFSWVESSRASR